MLHQRVKNAANTERWLDDVGDVLSHRLCPALASEAHEVLAEFDLSALHLRHVNLYLAVFLQRDVQLLAHILGESIKSSLHLASILLELGAGLLLIQCCSPLLDLDRLLQGLAHL